MTFQSRLKEQPTSLRALLELAHRSAEFIELAQALDVGGQQAAFISASLRQYLIAAVIDLEGQRARPAVVIAGDDLDASDIARELKIYLSPRPVHLYPARGITYESHLVPPPHLVGLRIVAIDSLIDPDRRARAPVFVISATALCEKVPDPSLRPRGVEINVGDSVDLESLTGQLVASGYERVDQVEERGQFAVRGGILDIFPSTSQRAVRCELFGDEVEKLAWLSTFTQRSLAEADVVELAPASELGPELRELVDEAMRGTAEDGERPDVADILPLDEFHELGEFLPAEALYIEASREGTGAALADHWQDVTACLHDRDAHKLYLSPDAVGQLIKARAKLTVSAVSGGQRHSFRAQPPQAVARTVAEAEAELERLISSGYRAVVAWSRRSEAERAAYNLARLKPEGLAGHLPLQPGVTFTVAGLSEGFIAPWLKLALIPERRLLRRRRGERPQPVGRATLQSFTELRTGGYVVHTDHGIARLAAFETKAVAGTTRDYLQLEFRDGDRVFLPFDQMHKVGRYVGADAGSPALSKLGGKSWERVKARARRAAQELAGELINLYAERKGSKGHPFAPDSKWQHDFERSFSYRETDDQDDAIEDVKSDMESPQPMDRLICGDVGYGKTEVALRAAFKAAVDGKQVMVLAPTTVLAQQHYGSFKERFADFPVNVGLASRFRTSAQNRAVLDGFARGSIDVLVGTHRLLSPDVRPKDLGLLIIDEEQRFGVKQKELLRQMKLKMDVLAMSATPIPRTLKMSLEGLREISVITTPPEGRRPVKTYVGSYDELVVKRALEREHARGGQSFYLHDRVDTIDQTAAYLRELCPRLKFIVAHGQMDEGKLEQAMLDFLQAKADCLVCTTIVESGLDIPAANTLIIERSDKLGLAQLYQIRGRVGRSSEEAHAYLLYPSAADLTGTAAARLSTLSDYTELGSGLKIAMRDLEIRGAGNLLGDEQSGHVAAVGFELYCDLLDRAIKEKAAFAGEAEPTEPVRLDVAVDAYLPASYIPYEEAKIDLYRRISACSDVAELARLREEMADRFGPPPGPVVGLLKLQRARLMLGLAGARSVTVRQGKMEAIPIDLDSDQVAFLRQRNQAYSYQHRLKSVSLRVSDESERRFEEICKSADDILAAATSPSDT